VASLGRAILELVTDDTKLKAGLQKAGDSARDWGGKMTTAGGNIANGLRPLTSVIENVMSQSVEMASSLDESLNKVRVVFGTSAADIEAWSTSSAKSLGLSQQKALEAAGTFGNLFTAMGLGRPAASALSKDVVQLAADLASFNNIKPEEALEKLRAGLVGEAEPLRTLGVNISAATVAAYAMKNGIGEVGRELTDAEKIQARFGLITQQTASAQGDFARTSDGLANSLRTQKAEQENVQAQLGTALIPVMKELTKITTGVVQMFASLSPEVQKVVLIVGGLLLVLGPLLTVLGVLTGAFGLFIGILLPAQGSLLATTVAVGGLNIALGPLILILGALALAALLLKIAWENNWGDIQGKAEAVLGFLTSAFGAFAGFMSGVWDGIVNTVSWAVGAIMGPIQSLIGLVQGAMSWISNLGSMRISLPSLPGFAEGGVVPGPVNAPMLAVVHGGETITPVGGITPRGNGAGHSHPIVMDGRLVARAVNDQNARRLSDIGRPV